MTNFNTPQEALRYHVTGAIARGEAVAITEVPVKAKRPTKAHFKSFVKKNAGHLYTKKISSFDGMTDCVETNHNAVFKPATPYERQGVFANNEINEHTLGYNGIWLVGGGRDYFNTYEDNEFIGYEYYNSCGNGYVVVRKAGAQ